MTMTRNDLLRALVALIATGAAQGADLISIQPATFSQEPTDCRPELQSNGKILNPTNAMPPEEIISEYYTENEGVLALHADGTCTKRGKQTKGQLITLNFDEFDSLSITKGGRTITFTTDDLWEALQ